MKETLAGFVGGREIAIEVDAAVADRFRETRLKLYCQAGTLLGDLMEWLPPGQEKPTEADVVRFLDHLDAQWGLKAVHLPGQN